MIIYVTICSIYDSRFMVTYCLNNQWHYFARALFDFFSPSLSICHKKRHNRTSEYKFSYFRPSKERFDTVCRLLKTHFKIKLCLHLIYLPYLCLLGFWGQNVRSNYGG